MTFRIDDLLVSVVPATYSVANKKDCGKCTDCTKCTKCTKRTGPPTGCSDSGTDNCSGCLSADRFEDDLEQLTAQLDEVLVGAGR